jgi:hypothetical protein
MRIIVYASIILFVLTGVATADNHEENKCKGTGHKNVKIEYGDGKFVVDAVVRVHRKQELRFRLHPAEESDLGIDYAMVEVETVGKTKNDEWLNAKGKNNHYFMVCVGEKLKEEEEYSYSVQFTIEDPNGKDRVIGLVDPKVIIEPDD